MEMIILFWASAGLFTLGLSAYELTKQMPESEPSVSLKPWVSFVLMIVVLILIWPFILGLVVSDIMNGR